MDKWFYLSHGGFIMKKKSREVKADKLGGWDLGRTLQMREKSKTSSWLRSNREQLGTCSSLFLICGLSLWCHIHDIIIIANIMQFFFFPQRFFCHHVSWRVLVWHPVGNPGTQLLQSRPNYCGLPLLSWSWTI